MAELKTRPGSVDPADFLASLDDPVRRADAATVMQMMHEVSGEPPVMWGGSIIGFGRYHYTYDSGHSGEWARLGLSPRKAALSVYIMPGFDGHQSLLDRLGRYKTGKSCLYIKRLQDVDVDVLRELIAASWAEMARRYPEGGS
jgi:hypothetical protein